MMESTWILGFIFNLLRSFSFSVYSEQREIAVLYTVVQLEFAEEVTFQQRPEGNVGGSQVSIVRKSIHGNGQRAFRH